MQYGLVKTFGSVSPSTAPGTAVDLQVTRRTVSEQCCRAGAASFPLLEPVTAS
jgi:hypothetical protein